MEYKTFNISLYVYIYNIIFITAVLENLVYLILDIMIFEFNSSTFFVYILC